MFGFIKKVPVFQIDYIVYSYQGMHENSRYSHLGQLLVLSVVLFLAILILWYSPNHECAVISHVFFICISLITNDDEYCFMCFFAIHIYSSVKCPVFPRFFTGLFSYHWLLSVFYVLMGTALYQIWDLEIFSPVLSLVFSVS